MFTRLLYKLMQTVLVCVFKSLCFAFWRSCKYFSESKLICSNDMWNFLVRNYPFSLALKQIKVVIWFHFEHAVNTVNKITKSHWMQKTEYR